MVKKIPSDIQKIIAINIKKFRTFNSLSQEELSFLSGIHRTHIGSIERAEKNISLNCLSKIAKALKIDICTLLSAK